MAKFSPRVKDLAYPVLCRGMNTNEKLQSVRFCKALSLNNCMLNKKKKKKIDRQLIICSCIRLLLGHCRCISFWRHVMILNGNIIHHATIDFGVFVREIWVSFKGLDNSCHLIHDIFERNDQKY